VIKPAPVPPSKAAAKTPPPAPEPLDLDDAEPTGSDLRPSDHSPPRRRRWRTVGKWALIALGFHVLCFLELLAVVYVAERRPERRALYARIEASAAKRKTEDEAREEVQKAVKRSLRSPTTATFDYAMVRLSETDTDVYVVSGEVHAQNGFGAMIRNYYAGKVRRHSNGEWVRVGELVISDDLMETLKVK
jgi:hypothetical protein